MDDDPPVDLFGKVPDPDEEEEGGQEEEDGEPEDDFNAAWEVLDLARAIYDKQAVEEGDEEVKLKLADTYIALGDVSLETGASTSLFESENTNLLTVVFLLAYRKIRPSHFGLRGWSKAQSRPASKILPSYCRSTLQTQHRT